MKSIILYSFLIGFFWSCQQVEKKPTQISFSQEEVSDTCCVKEASYKKGDVRRYGIFPNKRINTNYLKECLELADLGLPLYFPEGQYNTSIVLKGYSNVRLKFNNSVIAGGFQIINNDSVRSQNIIVKGEITILDKLFIKSSENIKFNKVNVVSDTLNNLFKSKNRGVSIYWGSKNVRFQNLTIEETGGDSTGFFKYTAAALQVHGYNNNPEGLFIKKLIIKNPSRTGLYLTGNNHKIHKIEIENFGLGSNENMFGLEDAKPKSETEFVGAWLNKCNDCTIDTLVINASANSKKYAARFDLGIYSEPCIINNIKLNKFANKLPIKDDELTNVLVKNILD